MKAGIGHLVARWSACAASLLIACAKDGAPVLSFADPLPARVEPADDFVLAFSDEFEAAPIAPARWFVFNGDPHHKETINSASRSMATVRDGSIFLSAMPTPEDKAFPYAAGYVDTHGLFAQTYGKIEFRARSQYAPGVWYAVWGRSWANLVPEIDVEFLAENINQVWFVDHWGLLPAPAEQRRAFTTVEGMDITDFHTYAITWKPDLVEWQIDGKAYMRITDPKHVPHEPMFWVMNAWVGGWGGTPSPATQFPARLEVDYLRIYRLRELSTDPVIRIANGKKRVSATDTIDAELADFAAGAHVEVWDGETIVERLATPPFRFHASRLKPGPHSLAFVGTDGARKATTSLDVTVY